MKKFNSKSTHPIFCTAYRFTKGKKTQIVKDIELNHVTNDKTPSQINIKKLKYQNI